VFLISKVDIYQTGDPPGASPRAPFRSRQPMTSGFDFPPSLSAKTPVSRRLLISKRGRNQKSNARIRSSSRRPARQAALDREVERYATKPASEFLSRPGPLRRAAPYRLSPLGIFAASFE